MSTSRSPTLSIRARGPLACFTRPELSVNRVSYPVMTPASARGVLEALLWKPAIFWHVERIHVLRPIAFTSFRRNEVNSRAVPPAAAVVKNGGATSHYFADDDRAQRNTVALRDVDYVIEAHMKLTKRAGPGDNMTKFVDMFRRRVRKGQHFHQPYFGCREFVAEVLPVDQVLTAIDDDRDLGIMLWDIDFSPKGNKPIFFAGRLTGGILQVPADPLSSFAAMADGVAS